MMVEGQEVMLEGEALESSARNRIIQACSKLSHLLAPEYCRLAFTLPPTSTSIWDVVEEDIDRLAQEAPEPCTRNTQEVLSFMEHFFAKRLVQRMCENFRLFAGSHLGLQYTLRLGLAGLGETVVDDLVDLHVCQEDGPLYNFFGACEGQIPESFMDKLMAIIEEDSDGERQLTGGGEEEWKTPKKTFKSGNKQGAAGGVGGGSGGAGRERGNKRGATAGRERGNKRGAAASGEAGGVGGGSGGAVRQRGADGGGASGEAGGGGADGDGGGSNSGSGGGGADGGEGDFDTTGLLNDAMIRVDVWLSEFVTPPKGRGRKNLLAQRSLEFVEHGSVEKPTLIYNPWVLAELQEKVFLYHGTRTSSLISFKEDGINPPMHRNEFSFLPAFYTSNSLRYAYEHPLHNHPSKKLDPISVFVFEVDARVLHGESLALGMEKPFMVKWFPADTEKEIEEWPDFSLKNLKRKLKAHNFDIVIGPVCLPNPTMDQVSKLRLAMDGGVEFTQVAFCSSSSREWLASCARKIYCEKRRKK